MGVMSGTNPLGLSDSDAAFLAAISKGYALLRRASQRNLAAHADLNRAQFEVLEHLSNHPDGLRMYELANLLVLSRGTLTYHLSALEQKGLATRDGGTTSRRAVRARITEEGLQLLHHLRASYAQLLRDHLFDGFSPEAIAATTEGFNNVIASFEDRGESPT